MPSRAYCRLWAWRTTSWPCKHKRSSATGPRAERTNWNTYLQLSIWFSNLKSIYHRVWTLTRWAWQDALDYHHLVRPQCWRKAGHWEASVGPADTPTWWGRMAQWEGDAFGGKVLTVGERKGRERSQQNEGCKNTHHISCWSSDCPPSLLGTLNKGKMTIILKNNQIQKNCSKTDNMVFWPVINVSRLQEHDLLKVT